MRALLTAAFISTLACTGVVGGTPDGGGSSGDGTGDAAAPDGGGQSGDPGSPGDNGSQPGDGSGPHGRPDLPTPAPPTGTWAFDPGTDTFDSGALLDLSDMNEAVAGATGFVALSPDGSDFVRGDGSPLRFWAVNTVVYRDGMSELQNHARFLAKRGVNMVRWHGNIQVKTDTALTSIDTAAREELWQLVAAMKQEGIYVTLSPYYPHATTPQASWPTPRSSEGMTGLLFFDPVLQAAYKDWLRAIFEPANPHTSVALKDEPAVAIIQIQNEDSLLFWTVANILGADLDILRTAFADWLEAKYGSLAAALTAWQDATPGGDDMPGRLPAFYHVWDLTQPQTAGSGKDLRLSDQLQFWTETMRDFNAEIVRFLREDIGAQQLVNAGNWRSADTLRLDDAERYSYTSTEVIGVNRYYTGGEHIGTYNGWAIVNGDLFDDQSVLFNPQALPVALKVPVGHPMIIPESLWVPPLGHQSEGPFLVSVFQSLSGVDAFYWFSTGDTQWRQPSSANGFLPSLGKWVFATPELLGNFPAAALIWRNGLVARGDVVVDEKRSYADLWNRQVPIIAEGNAFDPNRDGQYISPDSNIPGGVDPFAFAVGPIQVEYGADSATSQVINLDTLIDDTAQTVESVTGEVHWDYGRGICTVSSPWAQGFTGFVGAIGRIDLDEVSVTVANPYATLLVVSMDAEPIAHSSKILIQTGTIARPTGWQQQLVTHDDRQMVEIVNYGMTDGSPWQVVDNAMHLAIFNDVAVTAEKVTANGMPAGNVTLTRDGGWVVLQVPADAKYVILQ